MWRRGHVVTVLTVLWLAVSHSDGVTYNCDPGWRYFEGSCYLFSLVSHTWVSGRHDCRCRFTDLAKVQATSTNTYFTGRQTTELRKSPLWIGLNDRQQPNTFVWSDGSALAGNAYSNWVSARPDDVAAGHCVQLYGSAAETERVGKWVATQCTAPNTLPVCQTLPLQDPWVRDHADCGPGWYLDPDTDLCFLLQTSPQPWEQARAACVSSGSHLTTVMSAPQQLFLNRLTGRLGVTDNTWLGARGLKNGSLVWSSGIANSFRNFHPHESLPDVEDRCLSMKTSDATSFWDSESCSMSRPSLCQKPARQADRCGNWSVFSNVCYKVFSNLTWQAASTACAGQGGRLGMVKTQAHFDFVFDLLRQFYAQLPPANSSDDRQDVGWLGLTLASTDGGPRTFQWVDGSVLDDSLQYWLPDFNFTDRARLTTLLGEGATCVGVDVTPYVRKTEAFRFPRPCSASLPFVCQKPPTFERPPLRGTGAIDESLLTTSTPRYDVPSRPTEQVFVPGGQSHSSVVGSIVGPIVGALVIIAIVVGVSVFLKFYLPNLPENHVIRRSIRRLSTRMRRSGRRQMQSPYSQSFVELSAVTADSEDSGEPPAVTETSGLPPKPARNGGPPSQNGGPRRGHHPRGFASRGGRDGPMKNGDVSSGGQAGGRPDVTAGRPLQGPPPAEPRGRGDPGDRKPDLYYNLGAGAGAPRSPDDVRTPRGTAGSGDGGRSPRDPSEVTLSPSYLPADVRASPSYLPADVKGRPGDVRSRPDAVRTPRGGAPGDVRSPYSNVPADVRGRPGEAGVTRGPPPPIEARVQSRNPGPPPDVTAQRGTAPADVRRQERPPGPGDRRPDPHYNAGPPDKGPGYPRPPQGAQAAGGAGRMPRGPGPYDVRGPPGGGRGPGDVRGPPGDVRGRPGDVRGRPGDVRGPPGEVRGRPGDVRGPPGDVRGRPGNVRGPPGDVRGPPGDVRGPPGGPMGRDPRGGDGRSPNVRGPDPRAGGAGYGGGGRQDGPPRSQNV